jgi:hypothetical protein
MIFLFIADVQFEVSYWQGSIFPGLYSRCLSKILFLVTACKSTACPEVIDVVLVAWGAVWCPIQLGQSSVSATIVY